MAREYKNYELRPVPRPLKTGRYLYLSSTVAIHGLDGKSYYCYVSFSDKLVTAVGRKLPRGIYETDPAYLHVKITSIGYYVYAKYALQSVANNEYLLWSGDLSTLPNWLNFYPAKV